MTQVRDTKYFLLVRLWFLRALRSQCKEMFYEVKWTSSAGLRRGMEAFHQPVLEMSRQSDMLPSRGKEHRWQLQILLMANWLLWPVPAGWGTALLPGSSSPASMGWSLVSSDWISSFLCPVALLMCSLLFSGVHPSWDELLEKECVRHKRFGDSVCLKTCFFNSHLSDYLDREF